MKKVVEETIIKCGNCNNPLAIILVSQTNQERIDLGWHPLKSQYRIYDCPKCSGSSFISKVFEGTANIMSAQDFDLDFQSTEFNKDIIVSKLKIKAKQ